MIPESVIKAVDYLKMGRPVIIRDRDDREGEGDLAFSAKHCTTAMVNTALTIARGLLCVSLPPDYARKFNIKRMESNNKDTYDTPFGFPVSLSDGSSGVSAQDRNETICRLADINSTPEMFCMPGHTPTLIAKKGGLKERDGHTEAILDLLQYSGIGGPGVICEILNSAGAIATKYELESISSNLDIPIISIQDIAQALDSVNTVREAESHVAT
ncbi:MAG: 3,4-dihydroxy-2-butanone-4-phosphate synthase [Sedimenticola sp.]